MKELKMVYVEMYADCEGRNRKDELIAVVRSEEEAKAVIERYEEAHKDSYFPWCRWDGKLIFTVEDFKNEWA